MAKNNIVLYEPEIPQNTGNIMRTCAGTNTKLHLIKPLGFEIDNNHLVRAGVNYINNVDYEVYENWEDFLTKNPNGKKYYFIIGKESTGIPKRILRDHLDDCIRLPMTDKIRALNVSNVAAIVIYEALRQQDYNDLSRFEPETLKGKDWLLKD